MRASELMSLVVKRTNDPAPNNGTTAKQRRRTRSLPRIPIIQPNIANRAPMITRNTQSEYCKPNRWPCGVGCRSGSSRVYRRPAAIQSDPGRSESACLRGRTSLRRSPGMPPTILAVRPSAALRRSVLARWGRCRVPTDHPNLQARHPEKTASVFTQPVTVPDISDSRISLSQKPCQD